jgi:hypothetical protein
VKFNRRFECHFCQAEFYFDEGISGRAAELSCREAGWERVDLEDAGPLVWRCPRHIRFGEHTPRHAALATAVKLLCQFQLIEGETGLPGSLQPLKKRMEVEVEKWAGTEDRYALGIMAPLYALGNVPDGLARDWVDE